MALIITLILLSVILVMIIALLAVARRERASVGTSTDATTARLASDTALQFAQAQIIANLRTTNAAQYGYGLLVSTNYQVAGGIVAGTAAPAYVSYYDQNGNLLQGDDFNQVVTNLQILPRAPVMVSAAEPAGRFYLDLNRNGTFEDSGTFGAIVDENGVTNRVPAYQLTGDPQWVGLLQNPGAPHAADNKFLSRYAYIVLPVGQSLDLNYAGNEALNPLLNPAADGYVRNQGVGSWEINLAAFLADLNTNQWPTNAYNYNEPAGFPNTGVAFYDAYCLLTNRYASSYGSLATLANSFSNSASLAYGTADLFPIGPLATNTALSFYLNNNNNYWPGSTSTNQFYTLADFFDPTKSAVGVDSFTNRLTSAGTTLLSNGARPTYDRYTFYRMLDQLGTDTLPDEAGKMNLNYDNLDGSGNVIPGAETNLISWTTESGGALRFFTNAADRLLKVYSTNWFQANPSNYLATYFGIYTNYYRQDSYGNIVTNDPTGLGLTNLPVYGMTNQIPGLSLASIPVQVNGQVLYSPAINRLLQLAANLYDASTNAAYPNPGFFPSVFRPTFLVTNQNGYRNVYINGYQQVTGVIGPNDPQLNSSSYVNIANLPFGPSSLNYGVNGVNVYGVPWIVGAKKYMPNFNTLYSYDTIQVTRKLQVNRPTGSTVETRNNMNQFTTNEMVVLSVTNHVGFSFWNSYANQYPGNNPIVVANCSFLGQVYQPNGTWNQEIAQYMPQYIQSLSSWPGTGVPANSSAPNASLNTNSFVASTVDFGVFPEASVIMDVNGNVTATDPSESFANINSTALPSVPDLQVGTTNLFQGYILDGPVSGSASGNYRVLDYVNFAGPSQVRSVTNDVADPYFISPGSSGGQDLQWSINLNANGLSYGIFNQMDVSVNYHYVPLGAQWKAPLNMPAGIANVPAEEAAFFKAFFTGAPVTYNNVTYYNTNTTSQAPYTPSRTVNAPLLWMVNDPLVHYLPSDLNDPIPTNNSPDGAYQYDGYNTGPNPLPIPNLLSPNPGSPLLTQRYQPWSEISQMAAVRVLVDTNPANMAYKDPLVYTADNWDFPGNKYPTVGWIGRVHRGTPWQTVYLKATNILALVTNNVYMGYNTWNYWTGDFNNEDAGNMSPAQDELLFDSFTTSPDENATRGTLSVNQRNLAAWSALFSGMIVPTNSTGGYTVIPPAGIDVGDSYLGQLYTNIASTRALQRDGVFHHLGEILQTPSLTQNSPFLTGLAAGTVGDELYEWLPQQTLGLLRLSSQPRYVIYSFGQTLKPAPGATVLSSQFYGLVTNYQVAAESATRAVVTVQPSVTNQLINGVTVPVTNYTMKVESFNVLPPQ